MKNSLKNKMIFIHTLLWLPFFMILILLSYWILSSISCKQVVSLMKAKSYESQLYLLRYMQGFDRKKASQELYSSALHLSKNIFSNSNVMTQIYSKDKLLASSGKDYDMVPKTKDVNVAFKNKAYIFFCYKNKRYISFSSPIFAADNSGTEVIGVIRYIYPMTKEYSFILRVVVFIFIFCSIIIILNIMLTNRVMKGITASFKKIRMAVSKIKKGDLNNIIETDSCYEIAQITKELNNNTNYIKEHLQYFDKRASFIHQYFSDVGIYFQNQVEKIAENAKSIEIEEDLEKKKSKINRIFGISKKILQVMDSILIPENQVLSQRMPNIADFNIYDCINDVKKIINERFPKYNIKIKNNCDKTLYLSSDIERLNYIFISLISNAIIYSTGNEFIFKTVKIGDVVKIYMEDNGHRIYENDNENILSIRYNVDTSMSKFCAFNIMLCKYMLGSLKGKISISKKYNTIGTEIVIQIPVVYYV